MRRHAFAFARRWVAREARTAPRLGRAGLGAACLFAGGAGLAWAEPTTTPRRRPIQSMKTQRGVLEDDYELGEKLGSGFYGNVYRGKCLRTGMAVAIKVLPRTGDREADATVRREVAAMRGGAMHTAITEIHEFYESSDHFYIVMEFVDGGELLDLLVDGGPFREPRAAALIKEVGGAIALLHAQGMCHSDIKPENIVLTKEGQVRLIDFGTTFAVDAKLDQALNGGTVQFFAPETIASRTMGLPSDLWALGVVLFMTVGGYHPFDGQGEADIETTAVNIRHEEPDFADPVWEGVSEPCKHLLHRLLRKDPDDRLTVEQLLQHPWVRSGGKAEGEGGASAAAQGGADPTAGLRAAVFATILQQQVQEQAFWRARQGRSKRLRTRNSIRARMLDRELLWKAFNEFDKERKGYITADDLSRVLLGWGQDEAAEAIQTMLAGCAGGDREGSRVTYGNYISMMGLIDKGYAAPGEIILREGGAVDHFYALLSGKVEVLSHGSDGSGDSGGSGGKVEVEVLNVVRAGEDCYFGEAQLLDTRAKSHTVRCAPDALDGCELLKLAKADFDAGFVRNRGKGLQEKEMRRRLLGFIQMVSPNRRLLLKQEEAVFHAGDAVDAYYILRSGQLRVAQGDTVLAHIEQGSGFGESSLLAGAEKRTKTVTCSSKECELVTIAAPMFLRLVERSSVIRDMMQKDKDRVVAANQPKKKGWLG